jgi:hypothetical protein
LGYPEYIVDQINWFKSADYEITFCIILTKFQYNLGHKNVKQMELGAKIGHHIEGHILILVRQKLFYLH